jgi:filamentous hemagglutinin family protein
MMPLQKRNHSLPAHSAYRARKAQPLRAATAPHLQPHRLSWALANAFAAAFAASALVYASASYAQTPPVLPQGGAAVHGGASFQQNGNTLNVNTTNGAGNKSIINWQSFNVGAGHTTNINQPSASSSSLNRVVTNTPSQIHGQLRSNGQVILVNQSGIAVGAGGVVDTAAFTASTLNISDADYKAGKLRFEGNSLSKGVQVDGTVRSSNGDVLLFAPQSHVSKDALVKADNGTVILGAGQSVEVTGRGLEGVRFIIQSPEDKATNLGTLQGNAVGIFAGSLRHSGVIKVQTASMEGGRVVLRGAHDTQVVKDPVTGAVPQIIADGGVANGVAQSGGQIRVESTQGNVIVGSEAVFSASAGGISSPANSAQNKQIAPVNAGGGAIDLVANQGKVQVDPGAVFSAQGNPGGSIRIFSGQESRVAGVLNASSPALLDPNSMGSLQLMTPEQAGGSIQVLSAGNVALEPSAQLLASGDAAGGTILVGGDYQGANSEIVNAKNTNVSSGVLLEVNARVNGDGGKAIVWADNATYYAGNLQAKGGEQGGNGGFGETSGKKDLYFRGTADLRAPRGKRGTLLLDPEDIVIQGGSAPAPQNSELVSDRTVLVTDPGSPPATTFTISENAIQTASTGGDVILEAERSIRLTGTFGGGTNTLNLLPGGASLTLRTRNAVGDPVLAPGAYAIDLQSGTTMVGLEASRVTIEAGGLGSQIVPIRIGSLKANDTIATPVNAISVGASGDIVVGNGSGITTIEAPNHSSSNAINFYSTAAAPNTVRVNNELMMVGQAVTNGGSNPTNWSFETGAVGKTHNFDPSFGLSVGGTMQFTKAGTVNIVGDIGAFQLQVNNGATLAVDGTTSRYRIGTSPTATTIAGNINLQSGATFESKNSDLNISSTGQLGGSGTVNMGNQNLTILGTLAAGNLTITSGASQTPSLTGATNVTGLLTLDGGQWTNSGTMTVNGQVALQNNVTLTNATGGIINLTGPNLEAISTPSDTAPDQIINNGTINNKGTSPLGHSIGFKFTNNLNGIVNVVSGSKALQILGSGSDAGTYNVDAGTTLQFADGTRTLQSGSFLNGAGTLLLKPVTGSQSTTLSSANVAHVQLLTNGRLEIDEAELTIGSAITALTFNNPVVLKEDAVLNINGNMTGALNVSGTGSATISNAAAPAPAVSWTQLGGTTSDIAEPLTLSNINYINFGTFNNSGGVTLQDAASFTNNQVLRLQGTGGFSGAGVLNNSASGTICLCASSLAVPSTSIVNALATQAGTIELQAGRTLDVEDRFTNTGIIRGIGTLTVANAGLTNAATGRIVPGVAATPSPGVLNINGSLNNLGTIEVRTFSGNQSDSINVTGSSTTVNGSLVLNPVAPLGAGQSYLPVTAGGTGAVSGAFTSISSKSGPAIVATGSNTATFPINRQVDITSVIAVPPAPAPSTTNNWLDVDGDWSNAANWSLGVVPTAGQTVVINPSGTRVVTVSGSTSMLGLNFLGTDDTIFLTSGGLLNPPSGSSLSGLLRVDGGALGFNSASNANSIALSAGNLNVGSDLSVNTFNWTGGNLNLSGGSFSAGANGASGNVTVPTAGVMNLSGGSLANPVANSGLINVRSDSALAFASTSQNGRISISPGLALMLSGNPTFTTADAVTGGRLAVDTGSNLTLVASNNRGAGSITQLKGNLNAQADFSTGSLALEGGTISGKASAANRLSVTDNYSESGGGKIGTGFGALSIRQSKGDLSLANAVTLSGASPDVSLQSDEGNISAGFAHTAGTQFAALSVGSGKQATITLQGDALQSAPLASNGSVVLNMNGSDVQWVSDGNSLSNLRVNQAGRVSLDNDRSLTLSGDSSKGVVLNAFGTATLGDAITSLSVGAGGLSVIANADIVQGAAITITGDSSLSANGDIRLLNADNRIAGVLALNAASTDLKATGPITLTTSNAAGGVRVDTAGSLAVQGSVTGGGTVLLKGSGDVVLGGGTSAVEVRGAAGTSIEGGNIRLAGGTSDGASTRLGAGVGVPVSITTAGNFVIEGGSGAGSFAAVEATGNVNTLVGGTLSIIGGTGANAYAKLDPSQGALLDVKAPVVNVRGGSAPGAFAAVVSDGNINLDSRNLTLTPGTGADADAVVVSSAGAVKLPEQCNGCVVLTKNPLGNGVIENGVFSGATAPAPSPTPPAPPAPTPAPPAPGAPPPPPASAPPAPASAVQTVRDLVSIQLSQIDRVVLVATNSPDSLLNLASPEDQRRRLGRSRIAVEGDICRP